MPWNTTVTIFSTGQKVTAPVWEDVVENLAFLERVDYSAFTSAVNVTSTSSAAPDSIVSLGSVTYEAVPHLFEFMCPQVVGSNNVVCHLQFWDTSAVICRVGSESRVTSGLNYVTYTCWEFTPTAAAHTFSVRAYNQSAGTVTFTGGDGFAAPGATTNMPGFFRATRVPT